MRGGDSFLGSKAGGSAPIKTQGQKKRTEAILSIQDYFVREDGRDQIHWCRIVDSP